MSEPDKYDEPYIHYLREGHTLTGFDMLMLEKLSDGIKKLNDKFPCGHRKIDWDDSYGECVACVKSKVANEYDSLPLDIVDCHDEIKQLKTEIEALKTGQAAIEATLKLADFLNDVASRGAGFAEHWGERVLQAVEPLRNVSKFKDETLAHNRALLEANDRFVRELDELRAKISQLKTLTICRCGDSFTVDDPGQCGNCTVSQRLEIERLKDKLFALRAMEHPPCFVCGYNGPGYFQPSQHPCAAKHHQLATHSDSPDQTHYESCWRDRGHHACAVAKIAELEKS